MKEKNTTTEEKIIQVATKLFANKGYDGTSTREICKAANINISLISYYFGGKKELYKKIVDKIVENVISYMKNKFNFKELPKNFDYLTKEEKIKHLFVCLDVMIDYFYSDKVSDLEFMIIFREQMTSGVLINAEGYNVFKKLLASIIEKDENDREVILRTITIIGQVQSANIFKQFSLSMMNQSGYSKEDIQVLKQIIIDQVKSILMGLGAKC